ncbi:MAG TPA: hypothetical protein GXZ48_05095 [Acholeplasmataceae bacterium]|jgi:hypothetical protein|nr:hypothetical protein [Acholeplasmataceae bacterium]
MKKIMVFIFLVLLAGVTGCKQEKDPLLKPINSAIENFIDNHAEKYFTDVAKLDYYVVTAIKALDDHGYDISLSNYLSKEEVENYYKSYEYNTIGEIFKAIEICRAFEIDYDFLVDALKKVNEVDIYSYTYGLIALRITNVNIEMQDDLISKVPIIREEDYRDADYAGVALMATDGLEINRDDLFTLIDENISEDGVISWGNANSCSTANVILGLIALDIDPSSYGENDVDLVTALLKYHQDGAFKYMLDGDLDLDYATPQVFAAFASFKIYKESSKAFNLFL